MLFMGKDIVVLRVEQGCPDPLLWETAVLAVVNESQGSWAEGIWKGQGSWEKLLGALPGGNIDAL